MPAAETGPGHVDIVLLRAPRVAVCVDKFLVVGDRRVGVSGDDSKRERPVRLKRDVCWRMEERSAKFLVGFGHNDRIRGCDGVEDNAREVRVPVSIKGDGGIAARVSNVPVKQHKLPERRGHIPPRPAPIKREVDAAVVESKAAVVLTRDNIIRIRGVEDDELLGLPAQGAVLARLDVLELAGEGTAAPDRSLGSRRTCPTRLDAQPVRHFAICGDNTTGHSRLFERALGKAEFHLRFMFQDLVRRWKLLLR